MRSAWLLRARIGSYARPQPFRKANHKTLAQLHPHRWSSNASMQTLIYKDRPSVDARFLRDSCRCSLCVDPSTQQKHFHISEVPDSLTATSSVTSDGLLAVKWHNDIPAWTDRSHASTYSARYLRQLLDTGANSDADLFSWEAVPWDASRLAATASEIQFDYASYMETPSGLDRVVSALLRWGIAFVHGVPAKEESVATLGRRIGPLRNTFYGETWDVRSVAGAKNVAYTSQHLGFHQDLLYMAHPPDLQLLHVLRASAAGGESLFADGAAAVLELQASPAWPDVVAGLQVPATFRYCNDGQWYQQRRPILQKSGSGQGDLAATIASGQPLRYPQDFDAVNWSPQFQGPLVASADDLARYAQATRALRQRMELPESVYELRMDPGTCVIFNNRRIMHARRAFDARATGDRWLRGTYVDWDPLMSRWREARRLRGDITPGDDVTVV